MLTVLATLNGSFAGAADDGRSVAVLPGAFYSQETSVGLAVFGSYTTPLEGTGPNTWPASFTAAVVGTFAKQASATVWVNAYLGRGNAWALEGQALIEHFPTRTYGIGPTSEPSFQVFTRRQLRVDTTVRRRVAGPVYVGLSDHLAFVEVPGADGVRMHGAGLLLRWDTRDNNQSARRGGLVDIEAASYGPALGSTAALSAAFDNGLRWTAGGGARFELDESSHTALRLDVGAGPDGGGLIFTFGEAF